MPTKKWIPVVLAAVISAGWYFFPDFDSRVEESPQTIVSFNANGEIVQVTHNPKNFDEASWNLPGTIAVFVTRHEYDSWTDELSKLQALRDGIAVQDAAVGNKIQAKIDAKVAAIEAENARVIAAQEALEALLKTLTPEQLEIYEETGELPPP